jgi:DNA replication protein DnaC
MKFERFVDAKGVEWVKRVVTPEDSMRWAGVPSRFWPIGVKPELTAAVSLVQKLLAGEGVLLVLSGGTGCGKSTASAHALSRRAGIWVHAPDLAKPDFTDPDDYGVRRQTLDERMRDSGLLVLDDVGIEHSPRGYAASRITDVLEHREANRRPSIVTTNLTTEEFKEKYGARIASRLNGDPLGWQHVAGDDMRVNPPHWTERDE